MLGAAAPFALLKAANAFPGFGSTAAANGIGDIPICRAFESAYADPKGPPRHIRFVYKGTGICTAAVPVALHHGYFGKHKLDVEFIQVAGETDQMLQALATNKADAGSSMLLNWLKPLEQGIDVELTTGLHGGCTRLFAGKTSGITDITKLKGRTIGVSSISGSPRNFFAILLSDNGINPESDVQWREFPADLLPIALKRGEVQAIADADPTAWLIQQRGNGELVEIASNLSGDYANLCCCTMGVRASLWAKDPATVAALTNAIHDAAVHVATNPMTPLRSSHHTHRKFRSQTLRRCCAATRMDTILTAMRCVRRSSRSRATSNGRRSSGRVRIPKSSPTAWSST
ncbi:ABC transporter substrate-binding protein [Bradyrhizobium neotropicale]|uniref:ABC transporter substrate-binding protein n=1 Tax=Bradyrhizobium neotropicale TaxID=1497615 RepID=UPI001AD60869|nr:ABC transporter substrate-binding protein [Bradyrhizobium neotropicale]MBO4228460.1 ABC transporter substrate-binding protein [Bradyrhizobium neotropicale]